MTLSLPSGVVIDVTESTVLNKYIINDLQIFSHSLGTYDISEATLYNDLSNIGRTCYSCHFIRGAIVKGCFVSLTSSIYSTNISLMCYPVCSSTVIGCTYDIPSGICNMYVYDIEKEDTLSDDWAIWFRFSNNDNLSLLLNQNQLTHLLKGINLYLHVLLSWLLLLQERMTVLQ